MLQLILISIAGAIIGGFALNGAGAIIGFALGWLAVTVLRLNKKVGILENRLTVIDSHFSDLTEPLNDPRRRQPETDGNPAVKTRPLTPPRINAGSTNGSPSTVQVLNANVQIPAPPADAGPSRSADPGPDASKQAGLDLPGVMKRLITGGNPVVRIGVVVLFFGIGFLMKYAASHGLLPIEMRLGSSALAGLIMLAIGWRVRPKRPNYATVLQGGGIGVLYLTLFAAARLFGLIRLETAFGLMIVLVLLAGVLAVRQNTCSLAVFGAIGGFLAPILSSTGEGSHVMLFAFYGLLNAGILGVAWFKSWWILNITGFMFTFTIGLLWGLQFYRPYYFASTEPFLILHFLMYVGISILFAFRQPLRLRGFVDNTLVFGLPVAVFGLQMSLMRFSMSGLALSAFSMGAYYILLSLALRRLAPEPMRLLSEAFLANGTVFGSLAVPLALGAQWTAMAWALEGAALIWVGVRQRRCLPRLFGLMLQFGAGAAFVYGFNMLDHSSTGLPGVWLEGAVIALAGLFAAFMLEKGRVDLHRFETPLFIPVMLWGLLWWTAVGCREIALRIPDPHLPAALLAFFALSALAMGMLSRRLNWHAIGYPPLGLLPIMVLILLYSASGSAIGHPFGGFGGLTWMAAFGVQMVLLRILEKRWSVLACRMVHLGTAVLAITVTTWEAGFVAYWHTGGSQLWTYLALGIWPAAILIALVLRGHRIKWPVRRFEIDYTRLVPILISAYLLVWSLYSTAMPGHFSAMAYIPLFNPLDFSQILVLSAVAFVLFRLSHRPCPQQVDLPAGILSAGSALAAFVWLNALAARTVHNWGDIPFTLEALHASVLFHTAISVLWGIAALTAMVWANRSRFRALWFAGAGLLGLEVLKLFLIDLSGTGSVARIVSFLAVGGLMLLIGFFSPLPPVLKNSSRPRKAVQATAGDNFLDRPVANH